MVSFAPIAGASRCDISKTSVSATGHAQQPAATFSKYSHKVTVCRKVNKLLSNSPDAVPSMLAFSCKVLKRPVCENSWKGEQRYHASLLVPTIGWKSPSISILAGAIGSAFGCYSIPPYLRYGTS
jgi:hypothetical protein